jgi:hypothetical protein
MRGASNPARWGTLHSVLPLHWEKSGADFGFLLLERVPAWLREASKGRRVPRRSDLELFYIRGLRDEGPSYDQFKAQWQVFYF